jgi:dTDP-4-dehydrorhamnose 3,5-epimerase
LELSKQIFHSRQLGLLRGIHYSIAPRGQAKWITCVSGSIQDVIVDIRPDSKTFGQWVDVELKGDSGKAVLISEGLGHGFLALEDNTAVAYLVSTPFSQQMNLKSIHLMKRLELT